MSDLATHPSASDVQDFAIGKITGPRADEIAAHLDTCEDCCDIACQAPPDYFIETLRIAGRGLLSDTAKAVQPGGRSADQSATPAEKPIPLELQGHPEYEIKCEISRGGMGVVYKAFNRGLKRHECLKVIQQLLVSDPDSDESKRSEERFSREIQLAARLNHPNIVQIYHSPTFPNVLTVTMEFIDGTDLQKLVQKHGRLPIGNACFYISQAAQGLQHAFEQGMVHRDIKPNNLMLKHSGKEQIVKVVDFGLAKATSEQPINGRLTGDGQKLGTPHYMAPEQFEDPAFADIRADIYSLGCTFYYLLTGKEPYWRHAKSLFALMLAHSAEEPDRITNFRTDVPLQLVEIVDRMMAKSPNDRFQTPGDVDKVLRPYYQMKGVSLTAPDVAAETSASENLLHTTILKFGPDGNPLNASEWKKLQEEFDKKPVAQNPAPNESPEESPQQLVIVPAEPPPVVAPENSIDRRPSSVQPKKPEVKAEPVLVQPVPPAKLPTTAASAPEGSSEAPTFGRPRTERAIPQPAAPKTPKPTGKNDRPPKEPSASPRQGSTVSPTPPPKPVQPEPNGKSKGAASNSDSGQRRRNGQTSTTGSPKTQPRSPQNRIVVFVLAFIALVSVGYLLSTIISVQTSEGTLVIEANVPNPEVFVDGDRVIVKWGADGKQAELRVKPGERLIELKKDGYEVASKTLTITEKKQRIFEARLEPRKVDGGQVAKSSKDQRKPAREILVIDPPPASQKDQEMTKRDNSKTVQTPSNESSAPAPPTPENTKTVLRVGTIPGERVVLTVKNVDFAFRWCPAGKFMMGSPKSDKDHMSNEDQVEVTFNSGFWMLETEVTQKMWIALKGPDKQKGWTTEYGKGDAYPAYSVTWQECKDFGGELTKEMIKAGLIANDWKVDLPSEAEWEYACRAGAKEYRKFCFGDDEKQLAEYAWFGEDFKSPNHPVGRKKANDWGLRDMHGSVWEWTDTWYADKLMGGLNPRGPAAGSLRVVRGGGCWGDASNCRSAYRDGYAPSGSFLNLGFRLLVVPVR